MSFIRVLVFTLVLVSFFGQARAQDSFLERKFIGIGKLYEKPEFKEKNSQKKDDKKKPTAPKGSIEAALLNKVPSTHPSIDEIDRAMKTYNIDQLNYSLKSDTLQQDYPEENTSETQINPRGQVCRIVKILIDKSEKELKLYYGSELQKTYKVNFGSNPKGKKEKRNDGKTPEGNYHVSYKNAKSQFYKAFAVSYPNADDIANARTKGYDPGGDIMIHGLRNKSTFKDKWEQWTGKDWTAGCIALTNEEMDELWTVVDTGALIEIKP